MLSLPDLAFQKPLQTARSFIAGAASTPSIEPSCMAKTRPDPSTVLSAAVNSALSPQTAAGAPFAPAPAPAAAAPAVAAPAVVAPLAAKENSSSSRSSRSRRSRRRRKSRSRRGRRKSRGGRRRRHRSGSLQRHSSAATPLRVATKSGGAWTKAAGASMSNMVGRSVVSSISSNQNKEKQAIGLQSTTSHQSTSRPQHPITTSWPQIFQLIMAPGL
ncbi:unnamed protein product [Polarella glacialis]|uniref:Uncharacterized protein n=1 Tax=Polarella glacialis TaxID=89957 RepID=A0A813LDY8_POLGL|nr:unnamed protein product [Polarella glacialis]